MKLRDLVLGGVLIAGLFGCASKPIIYGPLEPRPAPTSDYTVPIFNEFETDLIHREERSKDYFK